MEEQTKPQVHSCKPKFGTSGQMELVRGTSFQTLKCGQMVGTISHSAR